MTTSTETYGPLQATRVGNFDGDDRLDLVGPVYGPELWLFVGNGDGTFQEAKRFPLRHRSRHAAVADINGDGLDDVAVSNSGDDAGSFPPPPPRAIQIFLGSPETGLIAGADLPVTGKPGGLEFGDVDGDGRLDLVVQVLTTQAGFWVYPGRGDGTFADPRSALIAHALSSEFILDDANEDGRLDVIQSEGVSLGNGDGTFRTPLPILTVGHSLGSSLTAGDFNKDGLLDLAARAAEASWTVPSSEATQGIIRVALGRGDGTFQPPDVYRSIPGQWLSEMETADFTGDGVLDLGLSTGSPYYFSVLVGTGDGRFGMRQDVESSSFLSLAVADFNQDGRPDVAGTASYLTVMLNDSFTPTPDRPPVLLLPSRMGVTPYQPLSLRVRVLDPDSDLTETLVARFIHFPRGHNATFAPLLQADEGNLAWAPRAVDAGIYTVVVQAGNALTTSASIELHVAPPAGPPDGEQLESFFESVEAGGEPYELVAADFNGDGLPDLASTNWNQRTLSILLQRADHSFEVSEVQNLVRGGFYLATGDLNGDGAVDLVMDRGGPMDISVMLGRGDGTFEPVKSVLTPRQGYRSIGGRTFGLLDLDRDGVLDVVLLGDSSRPMFFLGRGDGTFLTTPRLEAQGAAGHTILTRDLNGDGMRDLLVLSLGGVVTALARTDGSFTPAVSHTLRDQYDMATGDANGDGRLDLVAAPRSGGPITVLLGRGDGAFDPGWTIPVTGFAYQLGLADFTEDGRDDVVRYDSTTRRVEVWPSGLGGSVPPRLTPNPGNASGFLVVELDGDGHLDLVARTSYTGCGIFHGNGDGTFGSGSWVEAPSRVARLAMGRFDDGGTDDLLVIVPGAEFPTGLLYRGDGNGSFGPGTPWENRMYVQYLEVADLNHDTRDDVILFGWKSETDTSGDILLANADGSFQPPLPVDPGFLLGHIAVADFNGDGNVDLTVSPYEGSGLHLLAGKGDGTFDVAVQVFDVEFPPAFVAGDIDGNGSPDLIAFTFIGVGNGGIHEASVLLNDGRGHFTRTGEAILPGGQPILADMNRDGLLDVVAQTSSKVFISIGTGNATFAPAQSFDAPGWGPLGLADFDGDGYLDVATANFYGGTVSVHLGSASGALSRRRDFGAGRWPETLELGDLDRNGLPDVVMSHYDSGDITILRNLGAAPLAVLPAEIAMDPPRIQARARGGHVRASIELPPGHDPLAIDPFSLRVAGAAAPAQDRGMLVDRDDDGLAELLVSFDRTVLAGLEPGHRTVSMTGTLLTGVAFEGEATVHILDTGGTEQLSVRAESDRSGAVSIYGAGSPGVEHQVRIFDLSGRIVRAWTALASEELQVGSWDGRRDDGTRCAPGVYFVRVASDGGTGTAKVVLRR